jgi:hypothetical protein
VLSANDCPPCFSRIVSTYALQLNDAMPDEKRQLLMRFVCRFSGTASTSEIEQKRAEFLAIETVKRILPSALRKAGLENHAQQCEKVTDSVTARAAAARAARAADAADAAAYYAARAAYAVDATAAAARAARAARAAVDATATAGIWDQAIELLEAIINIGPSASVEESQAVERLKKYLITA